MLNVHIVLKITKYVSSVHKMMLILETLIFVHTWAKSRPRYPEPLSVGSGSLVRAVDRPGVLTRPVGGSEDRWLGVLH